MSMQIHLLLGAPENCVADIEDGPDKELIVQRAQQLGSKWTELGLAKQDQLVRDIVVRVVLGMTTISIEVNTRNFCSRFAESSHLASKRSELNAFKIIAKFQAVRRRGELHLIPPTPNSEARTALPSVVQAIVHSREWYELFVSGEISTIQQLARKSGFGRTYVKRILKCARFSPAVTEALLSGKHPDLTLKDLLRNVPLDWREQEKKMLGYSARFGQD